MGFHDKEFEFSSGMIQTGGLFEMKSGRIEAKLKVTGSDDLYHAFWLVGKKMLPHLNVVRVAGNRMFFENIWAKESKGMDGASISFSRFRDRFFLISFDWSPNELRWSINGKPFLRMTERIPAEGMHLNFSSGVSFPPKPDSKGGFELAWVRCSQKRG